MTKHTAYIGLGSSLGNPEANLKSALAALNGHPQIQNIQSSSFYQTEPLGRLVQPQFLNAAAKLTTALSCRQLFELLQQTELELGRERNQHWGPRTIDLDLLFFDEQCIDEPDLIVPHEQLHLRSFVLRGLCELDTNLVHPKIGRTVRHLYDRLNEQNFSLDSDRSQLVSVAGNIGVGKTTLATRLAERLKAEFVPEKYDANPYLSDVYAGHKELALDSELFFLASGASQLTQSRLLAGRRYVSDYVFDKARIYASAWLKGVDFRKYQRHYESVKAGVADPVVVIYLDDTLENCLDRIHQRNRPYEQHIELGFLEHLAKGYDTLYTDFTICPLIRLRADECRDDEQVDCIANDIRHYLV
jgi:2-amino-4-hydroxy-6-hydroxymethyldihydropteridine diphosphokinase